MSADNIQKNLNKLEYVRAFNKVALFPKDLLELQAEVRLHPELVERLKGEEPPKDIAEWYGIVAAYCDVLLDGYYGAEDFPGLSQTLIRKLQEKRTSLIIIGATDI